MGRKKKQEQPPITNGVLAALSEQTLGFVTFFYDKNMDMGIISNFDSRADFKAMRADILKWCKAMDDIERNIILQNILGTESKD